MQTKSGSPGERPPADRSILSDAEAEQARAGRFAADRLAYDDERLVAARTSGIVATLGPDATVSGIVDRGFDKESRLGSSSAANAPIQAVISLPIARPEWSKATERSCRRERSVLLDNAPSGFGPASTISLFAPTTFSEWCHRRRIDVSM